MNAGLTLGSLFDGIAGFPLAAGRHGIKTVWTSEIEPNCIDIAGRHFPDAVNLGDITGIKGGEILFECESVLGYSGTGREEGKGGSDNPKNSPIGEDSGGLAEEPGGQMKLDFGRTADRIYINATKSVTLMGRAGGGGGKTGLYLLPVYTIAGNVIGRDAKHGGNQLGINQDVAPTLTSTDRHAVAYTQSGYAEYKEGVGTIKKSRGAAGGGSETLAVIIERIAAAVKYRVRRLTPLECERLDGFPDYWTRYGASGREMSDNARYMALGNSIAVPCAERVFIGIIKAEREESEAWKA